MSDQTPSDPFGSPGQPPAWQPPPTQPPPTQPGYGPPGYGTPGYGAPGHAVAPTHTKAVVALVLGILSMVCCPLIAAIAAIFTGRSAVKDIDRSGGRLGGRGMATAGWVLGAVSLVLTLVAGLLIGLLIATGNCHDTSSGGTRSFHCGSSGY